jgi:hypothetical protein
VETPDLTAVAEKLGRSTEHLTAEAQERAREMGDQLRHQLEDTVKPAVHDAAPSLGKGLLTLVQALAALPLILVRLVGRLVSTAESVPERGGELKERAEHLLHDAPWAKRQRRQQRRQLAIWTGAGFGLGVGVGWFLGRRATADTSYEPPLPVPPPAPVSSASSSTSSLPGDPFDAATAAEEVLEDQLAAAAETEQLVEEQLAEAAREEADAATDDATDRPSSEA